MKRIIIIAAVLLAAAPLAKAQSEISVGYGLSPIELTVNRIANVTDLISTLIDQEGSTIVGATGPMGYINLGYTYQVNNVLAFGANLGFTSMGIKLQDPTAKLKAFNLDAYTIMAAMKINWFRHDMFGMYSKLGLGAMIVDGSLMEDPILTRVLPTGHISLVGMEVGRDFCGFMELGAGFQGMLQAGVRFRF